MATHPPPPPAQQLTFPFLKLPKELRYIIYRLLVPHDLIHRCIMYRRGAPTPRLNNNSIAQASPTLSLLCTHPTIHSEILKEIAFQTRFSNRNNNIAESGTLVRNLELDLFWTPVMGPNFGRKPPMYLSFERALRTACGCIARLKNLEVIHVRWRRGQVPPKRKIHVLLRPLKVIRWAKPDVEINLHARSPLSSRELEVGQRYYANAVIGRGRERYEDAVDLHGDLVANIIEFLARQRATGALHGD